MSEWEIGTCEFCGTTQLQVRPHTAPAMLASGHTEDRTHKLCRLCSGARAPAALWRPTDNRQVLVASTVLYVGNQIIQAVIDQEQIARILPLIERLVSETTKSGPSKPS
jgi:hypothetical protein